LATGDFGIEAGTLFNSVFLATSFWAIGWFLYEDYESRFLCCQQGKDKGTVCRLFYIRFGYYSSLLPSLGHTGKAFISRGSSCSFFLLFDCFMQ
jgi:protoheme IX farnesyltransferase